MQGLWWHVWELLAERVAMAEGGTCRKKLEEEIEAIEGGTCRKKLEEEIEAIEADFVAGKVTALVWRV